MKESKAIPVALSVAGSDCSGGAGLPADLRTFDRLGVSGTCCVTAVVAQSPGRVQMIEAMPADLVEEQLNEVAGALSIEAAKIGMLPTEEVAEAAADFFNGHPDIPLVVDPVMCASAGTRLADEAVLKVYQDRILKRADLTTPNLHEAEQLLGTKITGMEDFMATAGAIAEKFGCEVLLKGGHFDTETDWVRDAWHDGSTLTIFEDSRIDVPDLHGSGCVLSAAITGYLAKGTGMQIAIEKGRELLRKWMIDGGK